MQVAVGLQGLGAVDHKATAGYHLVGVTNGDMLLHFGYQLAKVCVAHGGVGANGALSCLLGRRRRGGLGFGGRRLLGRRRLGGQLINGRLQRIHLRT